jgi:hypothetical protein
MTIQKSVSIFAVAGLIFVAGAFAPVLGAEEWKLYYKDADEKIEYYFDKGSIVRPAPKRVTVWQKVMEVDKNENKTDLWKAHVDLNCSKRQYIVLADTPTDLQKGKVVSAPKGKQKAPSDPGLEGPVLWSLMENVCP